MKDFETLTRAEAVFSGIRRRWKLGLCLLIVAAICASLLDILRSAFPQLFTPALVLIGIMGLYALLWLSSYIVVPILRHKRAGLLVAKTTARKRSRHKNPLSSSRMLPPLSRLFAWIRLKELRLASDYCFVRRGTSYLRMQWLDPAWCPKNQSMDMIKPWDGIARRSFDLRFQPDNRADHDEIITLTIERTVVDKREKVCAYWLPANHTPLEAQNAEMIELTKNVPVGLAYGLTLEQADGSHAAYDKLLCVITWLGDD